MFGHCGYEIYPRWFMKTPLGWLINSVTHHAQHHETFRANYGLYFNVWDRLMGTNHPEYRTRFELATSCRGVTPVEHVAADEPQPLTAR